LTKFVWPRASRLAIRKNVSFGTAPKVLLVENLPRADEFLERELRGQYGVLHIKQR
jgi:hypothetical protein